MSFIYKFQPATVTYGSNSSTCLTSPHLHKENFPKVNGGLKFSSHLLLNQILPRMWIFCTPRSYLRGIV